MFINSCGKRCFISHKYFSSFDKPRCPCSLHLLQIQYCAVHYSPTDVQHPSEITGLQLILTAQRRQRHDRSDIRHTPHQSLRQRDEPSWLQSLEREALQNAAGERGWGRRTENKFKTARVMAKQGLESRLSYSSFCN